ncbi:ABC transporter permease [Clostridium sp. MSJ-11]|uniref:ABC transporter permease n=1 Tax=Clostridium mobile TaxID=2841512 RepID=A0ABS6EKA5_9CLOT|nr:ABC transporter permease [Clostridium mobile]MBU5485562.1 ABC transporter permease [Clostridium mobile]
MNGFWSLVNFEYKKILRKRSVQITLLLAILFTVFSVAGTLFGSYYVDGKPYESNYDAMVKDRTYARALAGRQLDGELIMETVGAYSGIPKSDGKYFDTEEYQKLARPYSGIYSIVRPVFNTYSRRFNMEDFQVLTKEQADQFYITRRAQQEQLVEQTHMSAKAKEQVLALDARIKTPLTFSYTDGYTRFFVLINTLGLTAAFVMAICVAPLFSGEYVSGADQLILASKHGKNKLIAAKLFTGFSLAAVICLVLIALSYGLSMGIFGADGSNAPLQLYEILLPYPLTMGQTALLLVLCTFFACLMTAAITMLLSAKLKSPFGVIVLVGVLLIGPMLGRISHTNIVQYNLYRLFPTQMANFSSAVNSIQYELLRLVVKPYVFLPLFAAAVSVLLTPFVYRSFKNHQIV